MVYPSVVGKLYYPLPCLFSLIGFDQFVQFRGSPLSTSAVLPFDAVLVIVGIFDYHLFPSLYGSGSGIHATTCEYCGISNIFHVHSPLEPSP